MSPTQSIDEFFLTYSEQKLDEYFSRIQVCVELLSDDQLWHRGSEEENSVANLMLHLAGNVRQWICFGVAGQPEVRQRDGEFAARSGMRREELTGLLRDSLRDAGAVISSVPASEFSRKIRVQNYDINVLDAIYHVVEHFAYHAGQIIFITKLFTKRDLGFYAHLNPVSVKNATP